MPRIVAGTDLMAALRQSIEKSREDAPKAAAPTGGGGTSAAAAAKPARRQKASAARKAVRASARCCCRSRAARPLRKRRAAEGSARKSRRRKRRAQEGRIARRTSAAVPAPACPTQRAMKPIAAALAMSMKKAETSGRMMKACAQAPCSLVTAVMLAIAVGVAPRLTPVKPAAITAA